MVEKRDRTGKKDAGWHPPGRWHPNEINKSDSDKQKKDRQFFSGKKIGVTPSVAAPDDTNPNDATGCIIVMWHAQKGKN